MASCALTGAWKNLNNCLIFLHKVTSTGLTSEHYTASQYSPWGNYKWQSHHEKSKAKTLLSTESKKQGTANSVGADTRGLEGCLVQPQCGSFSWGLLRFLTVLYCVGITARASGSGGTSVTPYDSPMIRLGVHADTHLGVFTQDNLFTLPLP